MSIKRNPNIDRALNATVRSMLNYGFSRAYISRITGMSLSQISYRASAFDVHAADFRNGDTDLARRLAGHTPCAKSRIKAVPGEAYRVQGLS